MIRGSLLVRACVFGDLLAAPCVVSALIGVYLAVSLSKRAPSGTMGSVTTRTGCTLFVIVACV